MVTVALKLVNFVAHIVTSSLGSLVYCAASILRLLPAVESFGTPDFSKRILAAWWRIVIYLVLLAVAFLAVLYVWISTLEFEFFALLGYAWRCLVFIVCVFTAITLVGQLEEWTALALYHGKEFLPRARTVRELGTQSRNREMRHAIKLNLMWLAAIVLLAIGILSGSLGNTLPLAVCALIMYLLSMIYDARPPGTLLLGASGTEAWALRTRLAASAGQRVVCLLESPPGIWSGSSTLEMMASIDCYRTDEYDDWQTMFKRLADAVPMIVVDTRNESDAIRYEIAHIFAARLIYKTAFIVDKNEPPSNHHDSFRAIESRNRSVRQAKSYVSMPEGHVRDYVYYMRKHRIPVPTPERPIADSLGSFVREMLERWQKPINSATSRASRETTFL